MPGCLCLVGSLEGSCIVVNWTAAPEFLAGWLAHLWLSRCLWHSKVSCIMFYEKCSSTLPPLIFQLCFLVSYCESIPFAYWRGGIMSRDAYSRVLQTPEFMIQGRNAADPYESISTLCILHLFDSGNLRPDLLQHGFFNMGIHVHLILISSTIGCRVHAAARQLHGLNHLKLIVFIFNFTGCRNRKLRSSRCWCRLLCRRRRPADRARRWFCDLVTRPDAHVENVSPLVAAG